MPRSKNSLARFATLSIVFVAMLAACIFVGRWRSGTIRVAKKEESAGLQPWEIARATPLPRFSAFDGTSDTLYGCLVSQREAWESGLIAYLGIDAYTGRLDPARHRLVWWQAKMRSDDTPETWVFLADHRRAANSQDCSAYIVTDHAYRLLYWEKTSIDRGTTTSLRPDGHALPCKLSYHVWPRDDADLEGVTWVVRLESNDFGTPRPAQKGAARWPSLDAIRLADNNRVHAEARWFVFSNGHSTHGPR